MGDQFRDMSNGMLHEIHSMVSQMYARQTAHTVQRLPSDVADMLDCIEGWTNGNLPQSREDKSGSFSLEGKGDKLVSGRPDKPVGDRIVTAPICSNGEVKDRLPDPAHVTHALLEVTQQLQKFLLAHDQGPKPPPSPISSRKGKTIDSVPFLQDGPDDEQIELSEICIDTSESKEPAAKTNDDGSSPHPQKLHERLSRHALGAADEELLEMHASTLSFKEPDSLASIFLHDNEVEKPVYSVEAFYRKGGTCQAIARSNAFANLTVAVVALNAIYIGVESDNNDAQNIYRASWFFQACSQFFCIYFTLELLVRFLAFEKKRDCLRDGWFKFDAFLVSTMVLDTWVIMPTLYSIGGQMKIPTQPLRMLRLFKLTRMARLMKAFPELVTMIKGLVRSVRAISSSMILIGLMVYVWAIMMHMLMKDEKKYNETSWDDWQLGFGTLTHCMWTLFMNGTLMLDNTQPLMTGLLFHNKVHYVLAGIAFMTYSLLSALLILQMLIGVLCEVVSQVNQEQRDAAALGLVRQELLVDLNNFAGEDGKISQAELFEVMNNPKSRALLRKLNINCAYVLELQRMMFTRPGQSVSIKTILELLVMCRGDVPTTVETMAGGLLSVIHEITTLRESFEQSLTAIEHRVKSI